MRSGEKVASRERLSVSDWVSRGNNRGFQGQRRFGEDSRVHEVECFAKFVPYYKRAVAMVIISTPGGGEGKAPNQTKNPPPIQRGCTKTRGL